MPVSYTHLIESNGSTSMGSVCASTLSLMDAGVPITAPVAGCAMGLIKDGDDITIPVSYTHLGLD